jgi:hypothetical protein
MRRAIAEERALLAAGDPVTMERYLRSRSTSNAVWSHDQLAQAYSNGNRRRAGRLSPVALGRSRG